MMRERGYNVGGEQSGHVVLSDYSTTGDGLIAALQVLAVLIQADGRSASEVCRVFDPVPQKLTNVRFSAGTKPLEDAVVQQAIRDGEARLAASGRLLIRKSGTEPLIRVMAEGDDAALVNSVVADIADTIQASAARSLEAAQ
jgi:phosphoglucosamine mutase